MDDGIGRTGYRVIAAIFVILGLLGIGLTWFAIDRGLAYLWGLGLLFAASGILVQYIFAVLATQDAGGRPAPRAQPRPEPSSSLDDDWGFDFDVPQDPMPGKAQTAAPRRTPEVPAQGAPAPEAPQAAPAPQNVQFQTRDPRAWPGQKSAGEAPAKALDEKFPRRHDRKPDQPTTRREELTDKYTQGTPTVRNILREEPTKSKADMPPPPSGKSRGSCGQCGTILLAPKERPIRIRCPVCSKTTVLE